MDEAVSCSKEKVWTTGLKKKQSQILSIYVVRASETGKQDISDIFVKQIDIWI